MDERARCIFTPITHCPQYTTADRPGEYENNFLTVKEEYTLKLHEIINDLQKDHNHRMLYSDMKKLNAASSARLKPRQFTTHAGRGRHHSVAERLPVYENLPAEAFVASALKRHDSRVRLARNPDRSSDMAVKLSTLSNTHLVYFETAMDKARDQIERHSRLDHRVNASLGLAPDIVLPNKYWVQTASRLGVPMGSGEVASARGCTTKRASKQAVGTGVGLKFYEGEQSGVGGDDQTQAIIKSPARYTLSAKQRQIYDNVSVGLTSARAERPATSFSARKPASLSRSVSPQSSQGHRGASPLAVRQYTSCGSESTRAVIQKATGRFTPAKGVGKHALESAENKAYMGPGLECSARRPIISIRSLEAVVPGMPRKEPSKCNLSLYPKDGRPPNADHCAGGLCHGNANADGVGCMGAPSQMLYDRADAAGRPSSSRYNHENSSFVPHLVTSPMCYTSRRYAGKDVVRRPATTGHNPFATNGQSQEQRSDGIRPPLSARTMSRATVHTSLYNGDDAESIGSIDTRPMGPEHVASTVDDLLLYSGDTSLTDLPVGQSGDTGKGALGSFCVNEQRTSWTSQRAEGYSGPVPSPTCKIDLSLECSFSSENRAQKGSAGSSPAFRLSRGIFNVALNRKLRNEQALLDPLSKCEVQMRDASDGVRIPFLTEPADGANVADEYAEYLSPAPGDSSPQVALWRDDTHETASENSLDASPVVGTSKHAEHVISCAAASKKSTIAREGEALSSSVLRMGSQVLDMVFPEGCNAIETSPPLHTQRSRSGNNSLASAETVFPGAQDELPMQAVTSDDADADAIMQRCENLLQRYDNIKFNGVVRNLKVLRRAYSQPRRYKPHDMGDTGVRGRSYERVRSAREKKPPSRRAKARPVGVYVHNGRLIDTMAYVDKLPMDINAMMNVVPASLYN